MNESPVLEAPRTRLRRYRPSDFEAFAAMSADPVTMEHMPALLSPAETQGMIDRIEAHFEKHGFGLWVLEIPGVAPCAGFVGLQRPRFEAHFTPCVEVGWRLRPAYWGKGYATEAARVALAYGFDVLRLDEIVAMTVQRNERSWRVMERLGMTRDPKDDFDHPLLAEGHPLRRHILYRLPRAAFQPP